MRMMPLPLLALTALIAPAPAESLQSARVTRVLNEVRIFPADGEARPAKVGDVIRGATSIQTGRDARAELVFQDDTITRLGQNSVFSFRQGTRDLDLRQGSVLLQVPPSAGGATIRTATVTAAITGTTSMFEFNPGSWVKLLTLEGTQQLKLGSPEGRGATGQVPPGEMLTLKPDATELPKPLIIDIARILRTSKLLDPGRFGPLPPAVRERIQRTVEQQKQAKRSGTLLPTNIIASGFGLRMNRSAADFGSGTSVPRVPDRSPPPTTSTTSFED